MNSDMPPATCITAYRFAYTPILIKYVPAVLLDGQPQEKVLKPVSLKISNPPSRLPGVEQTYSSVSLIRIPSSGTVKLKLIPSDAYLPTGRYKVETFLTGVSIPVDTAFWVVPYPPDQKTLRISHQGTDGDELITADEPYEILSVSHQGVYELDGKVIRWLENPPEVNASYDVTYQPAITLDRLITLNP